MQLNPPAWGLKPGSLSGNQVAVGGSEGEGQGAPRDCLQFASVPVEVKVEVEVEGRVRDDSVSLAHGCSRMLLHLRSLEC